MEIQPIVVDDVCSDVKNDMIVAYSVSFPHMYEGEKVNSDNLIAIVDEKGEYTLSCFSEKLLLL